jgi:GMP synthase (glutamine-hydrolysing)
MTEAPPTVTDRRRQRATTWSAGTGDGVSSALVLAHDTVPGRGTDEAGTVEPALHRLGFDVGFATFLPGHPPVPAATDVDLLVVLGAEEAAYDDTVSWLGAELAYLRSAIDAGTPVLGICFGAQALARVLGATVALAAAPEHGFVALGSADPAALPAGTWMEFHRDAFTLPPGATLLAENGVGVQAFAHGPHLGVQFHPEITPRLLTTWARSWADAGVLAEVEAAVDLTALAAEIARREAESVAACHRLVELFCRRAAPV